MTEQSDNKQKHTTWGGVRAGAGRPATGKHERKTIYVSASISCKPEEMEALKQLVKESGKSLSRFVIESLLPQYQR